MKSRCLDGYNLWQNLFVMFGVVVLTQLAHGQASTPVSVDVSHVGDTSHLEFKGRESWSYDIQRETRDKTDVVVVTIPKVDAKSLSSLKTWTSPLVDRVNVDDQATDDRYRVSFYLKNKNIQTFDYQTDQPSRLIVDFFVQAKAEEKPKTPARVAALPAKAKKIEAAPVIVQGKESRSRIFKIRSDGSEVERKPASADFMAGPLSEENEIEVPLGSDFKHGIFDGADPEFDRFRVKDYEVRESAVIASQQNIYLRFPMLRLEAKPLQSILQNPPVYEIAVEDGNIENEEARFLQTLFDRKRYAVFQKTLKHFDKKYPASKYKELLHYMAADIAYEAWRQSQKLEDLERAMSEYREMLATYPESPLFERTSLLVGYSFMERGDHLSALREFQKFLNLRPQSPFRDHAKIALAEAYTGLNKFDEAVVTLQDVQKNPSKPKYAAEASYRMGDIFFQKHDYTAALGAYKAALKTYPEAWNSYPNAYFNSAESRFWLGQYKESLEAYREYLRRFPSQGYGGYAMTRLGELMEILGVDQRRVMGAFLESYFRYSHTPGGKIARIRLLSQRLKNMKSKELEKALEESKQITKESDLAEMPEFVTIIITDGLFRRGEYDAAIDRLAQFYQGNPSSKNLGFIQNRIVRNITQLIKTDIERGDFMTALKNYSKYSETWLKSADRIDVRYYVGRAYEQAGVFKEAAKVYRETLNRIYSLAGTNIEKERNVFEVLPSSDTLNLRLAATYLHEGDFARALDHVQQVKNSDRLDESEQVERVEIMAQVAEKTGHPQEATRYLAKLVETWSGKPQVVAGPLIRLAEMYTLSGDIPKAQIALARIMNLQTDTQLVPEDIHARALELKGDLLLKEKKTEAAIETYTSLLETYEKKRPLASVRYRLGDIEFKRGNTKAAEKVWASLEQGPNKVWHQMAQEQLKNEQFRDEYKKYINRIPAMANAKEGSK